VELMFEQLSNLLEFVFIGVRRHTDRFSNQDEPFCKRERHEIAVPTVEKFSGFCTCSRRKDRCAAFLRQPQNSALHFLRRAAWAVGSEHERFALTQNARTFYGSAGSSSSGAAAHNAKTEQIENRVLDFSIAGVADERPPFSIAVFQGGKHGSSVPSRQNSASGFGIEPFLSADFDAERHADTSRQKVSEQRGHFSFDSTPPMAHCEKFSVWLVRQIIFRLKSGSRLSHRAGRKPLAR